MNQCFEHYYALHQIPELDDEMILTKQYILEHLPRAFTVTLIEHGGILAYLNQKASTTIAFRSETDALPINETNHHAFISKHQNRMHACGHDGHMAILLTFANWLIEHPPTHNVLFIFEYAEETSGGAKILLQHPLFQQYHPQAIYALHLWPFLPANTIATHPHTVFGYSSEVNILIHGRSTHVSMVKHGIDANEIAGHFLSQAVIPYHNFLIRFGEIHGGHARNVLADQTVLTGTIRAIELDSLNLAKQYLWQLATLLMMRYENIIEVTFQNGYPAVCNNAELLKDLTHTLPHLQLLSETSYAAESFSFYQQQYPTVMLLLGTGTNIPLHSSNFSFPVEILETGLETLKTITRK